ncbi:hypothetical protein [Frankia gtarii]|uniref:hypothetical protein n=1 Tax=Frankia gtarii TaxID=2950102 RepID=UPI0021BE9698|nr:hypothetical protein [Frankia gtarii]
MGTYHGAVEDEEVAPGSGERPGGREQAAGDFSVSRRYFNRFRISLPIGRSSGESMESPAWNSRMIQSKRDRKSSVARSGVTPDHRALRDHLVQDIEHVIVEGRIVKVEVVEHVAAIPLD